MRPAAAQRWRSDGRVIGAARRVAAAASREPHGGRGCEPEMGHTGSVSEDDFTVELESDPDEVLTVRLDGELDMAHAAWVDDTLGAAGPTIAGSKYNSTPSRFSTRPGSASSNRSGPTARRLASS